jgi:phosphoribosylamine---glycine ligase
LEQARDAAYALVDRVRLDGAQYRTDIALAALHGKVAVPVG